MRLLRRLGGAIRTAWLMLGLSLLLLLLVDQLLDAALPDSFAKLSVVPGAKHPERTQMDAFASKEQATAYFEEFEQARQVAWRPYVYFRRKPYAGQSIHVDAHGFRVTPQLEDGHIEGHQQQRQTGGKDPVVARRLAVQRQAH